MLSIIIPTREEEKVIGSALQHLDTHLMIEHELIVSDGRSLDDTVRIAEHHADIVKVFTGEHHNPAIGRNDGAREAQHDYLVFIDADTHIPDPEGFFRIALSHMTDPAVVGVTGPQRALPRVERISDRLSFGLLNLAIRINNNVLHRGEASGKFMMVRREAFDKVGGFRTDLVTREDGDFFYRISKIGRTRYDPRLMVYHGARRAHALGWARLWSLWILNTIHVSLFDKALSRDWTPIR